MKIKKIIVLIILGNFALLSFPLSFSFAQEKKWTEEKSKEESDNWQKEIKRWSNLADEWGDKRNDKHKQFYGDDYEFDDRKFCDNAKCWEQDNFRYNYIANEIEKWELTNNNLSSEIIFKDGSSYFDSGIGQHIEYKGVDNEYWESGNFGQVLIYKNKTGKSWESRNFGQTVEYIGPNGESWRSVGDNYFEIKDSDGNEWSGSN